MRRHFARLTLATFAAAAAPCAHGQSPFDTPARSVLSAPVVTIPLVREGGFYYADVRMNGRPFRFTLETGAGFFGISNRAAAALGIRVDSVDLMPGSRSAVARIDSLSVGGASFHGLTARVSTSFDNRGFDGLISVPVLRDLLATLDLGRSQLRLERGALPAVNGRDVVEMAGLDRGGRVDVWMDFAGTRAPAVLDTRSFLWIIVPDSLESRLRLEAPPRSMGEARGPSTGVFQLRGARLAEDARIGSAVFSRPALSLRNRSGTVLGVPLLEQFEITIDQRNRRVRFSRPWDAPVIVPSMSWEAPAPGQRTMGFNMAGAPGTDRLRVLNLVQGSNAEKEGLKNGDVVVEFDGTPVASLQPSIVRAAAQRGVAVKVVVLRGEKPVTLYIVPER